MLGDDAVSAKLDREVLVDSADPVFLADVLRGLAKPQRAIPPHWFYDRRGSELFEEITRLPEYYLTEAERQILSRHRDEIAVVFGAGRMVVEFGSGSSSKTPLLLSAVKPSSYVPVDISGEFLRESALSLAGDFPQMPIHPVEADFAGPVTLPEDGQPRLGFFPGSTIGNLDEGDAVDLLRHFGELLGEGAMLLIGFDRRKSSEVLLPAYDDAQGVTARFNLNLLHRINAELGGDIDTEAFEHLVRWNEERSRIEMHLVARSAQRFVVAGQRFEMRPGETIHTENSYKHHPRAARLLLHAGGWRPLREWTDALGRFSVFAAGRV
jgi:dimethylhistidine N-methyltransferase